MSKHFDLAAFADAKAEFWIEKAGPGLRTAGLIAHIRKELDEIAAGPTDLEHVRAVDEPGRPEGGGR